MWSQQQQIPSCCPHLQVFFLSGSIHKINFTAISFLSNSHSFSYLNIKSLLSAVFFENLNQQTHCFCPEQLSICLPSDTLSIYTITEYLFTVRHGIVYRGLISRLTSSNCQGLHLYSSLSLAKPWGRVLYCRSNQHKIISMQAKLFEYMTPSLVPLGFSLIFHWADSVLLLSWVHSSTWQELHTHRGKLPRPRLDPCIWKVISLSTPPQSSPTDFSQVS